MSFNVLALLHPDVYDAHYERRGDDSGPERRWLGPEPNQRIASCFLASSAGGNRGRAAPEVGSRNRFDRRDP